MSRKKQKNLKLFEPFQAIQNLTFSPSANIFSRPWPPTILLLLRLCFLFVLGNGGTWETSYAKLNLSSNSYQF